jgi:hypothetical protein
MAHLLRHESTLSAVSAQPTCVHLVGYNDVVALLLICLISAVILILTYNLAFDSAGANLRSFAPQVSSPEPLVDKTRLVKSWNL